MDQEALIEALRKVACASLADAIEQVAARPGHLDPSIRPQINDRRMVGPAVTIACVATDERVPPQHSLEAIDQAAPGSVVVIGADGKTDVALWGGLMSAGAFARGLAGAVLDGGVRDVVEIKREYDFPIYARDVTLGIMIGRFKTVAANVPVLCGGITIHPGDIIVADADGVVAVPHVHAEAILKLAGEIDERETEQAKLIVQEKSVLKGLAKYGRI
ncbi:MAG: RraA family protein [Alphaproteobacteria bacterium]